MPPSPSKPKNKKIDSYRQQSEIYGRRSETLAAWYLRLKGYRILKTRYKTPVGEIDLIARRFSTTVFVEVKSRNRSELEREALLAVNAPRIVRAAQYYLTRNPKLVHTLMRFDVIFLAPKSLPRHVKNAFQGN
jgi:putative endonuclease